MIQDIQPYVYHNAYHMWQPNFDDYVMYVHKDRALLKGSKEAVSLGSAEEVDFPKYGALLADGLLKEDQPLRYLFSIDEMRFFLADSLVWEAPESPVAGPQEMPERDLKEKHIFESKYRMEKISVFRKGEPRHMIFAGITAFQIAKWYEENRYCGKCRAEMHPSETERAMVCPACGLTVYPKISPAVIVAVTDGDRLLLSKYAYGPYRRHALLAGFAEVGETIEETVAREVWEEVGLKVRNLVYYKSQPWSFSGSLLMGFFAEVDGSPEIHIDHKELAEAGWFTKDEIQIDDSTISLTNEMIHKFIREH